MWGHKTRLFFGFQPSDEPGDYSGCRLILEQLGLEEASDEDCASVRYVCELVSRRAAYLTGAGVAILINKMGLNNVTVAVDGSVYRFHPHFHDLMVEKIQQLVNPGTTVNDADLMKELRPFVWRVFSFLSVQFGLMLSEDGSGRGAAIVAGVVARVARQWT